MRTKKKDFTRLQIAAIHMILLLLIAFAGWCAYIAYCLMNAGFH